MPQRLDRERAESAGGKSDWERKYDQSNATDPEAALPALPKDGLIEFFVSSATNFRFFIDPPSLSVGADGVVRYTMIARSPAGAETITYEGIRCDNGTYRTYAFGNAGVWSRNSNLAWLPIEPKSVRRWHNVLRGLYFCPTRSSIQSAAEGLDALRRGSHPAVVNKGI